MEKKKSFISLWKQRVIEDGLFDVVIKSLKKMV